ncbi:hypothetical protein [Peredibacter starrii]|uniref:Uncharacterized protein n=1 Tax=Peredibacter starrii TaxID=28202 RepID=A0AAX4HPS2_9BACT|nr:hypothetical protein [Peredibacter starrii]WPU65316.1 hypothetical protein SOO65_00985 [Peredibacter starrii]
MKYFILLILFSFSAFAETTSFPEPMVYDLMRSLDAKKGETEINSLILANGQMSPEVEYAFKDGWSFELETPIEKGEIQALKWGSQYTFYQRENELLMGVQGIFEDQLHKPRNDYSLTLVVDYKLSESFSLVGISGMRSASIENSVDHNVGILNLSLFYTVSDDIHVGVENDNKLYFTDKELHINTIPQVSVRVNRKLRFQAGYGISWNDSRENQGILRGIVEF